jgi:hypothetical protein
VFYPVTEMFDVKLDSVEYSQEPVMKNPPKEGYRYCFAKFTIKNRGPRPARYGYSYFRADLRDADGEKTEYNTSILKASRDEESSGELAPGEEARIRFYFAIPKAVDAKPFWCNTATTANRAPTPLPFLQRSKCKLRVQQNRKEYSIALSSTPFCL